MHKPLPFFLTIFCFCFLCCTVTGTGLSVLQQTTAASSLQAETAPHSHADSIQAKTISDSSLLLTFAGDLMAHTVNFNMKEYDLIYKDVEKILHDDDLSFT